MRRYYNEVRSSLIFFSTSILSLSRSVSSSCFFNWSVVCSVALPTHSEVFSSAASHVQIYYVFRIRFGKNTGWMPRINKVPSVEALTEDAGGLEGWPVSWVGTRTLSDLENLFKW